MKTFQSFAYVAVLTALLTGCQEQAKEKAEAPVQQKKLRFAFIANSSSEYWSLAGVGCQFAAGQLGNAECDFRFPVERTVKAQEDLINSFVASGVDGIAVSPIDAQQQTEFLNGIAAKTLLVCADSDAAESKRVCYIGTDNVAAGREAGDLLKAALPDGGKVIMFVGYPNAQNTKDRVQGLQEAIEGSKIEIIETMEDQHKSAIAQKNAGDALAKHPDIDGMIGIYSYHGPAMAAEVRSAKKAGKVKIVCFDAENETLDAIAAGDIYGTVSQRPMVIGAGAIRRMGLYLRGDKEQLAGGQVFIPSQPVTKENVEQFKLFNNNLLHPNAELGKAEQ